MAYKKRTKRQASEIVPDEEMMDDEGAQDFAYQGRGGGGFLKFIVTILVIAIIIIGGWYLLDNYTSLNLPGMSASEEASPEGWHAVFLSNGQVYFGQIEKISTDELILTDIYYLQVVNKPLQQSQEGGEVVTGETQQELTLAKLGKELHGPTDRMVINRDHILLTEELTEDSKVVTAIIVYINEQAAK